MSNSPRELIRKPSAMIQTNVRGLTLTQRKLINALIKIAQVQGDKQEYEMPLVWAKHLCGITMDGNNDLKKQLSDLQDIKIVFNYLGKDSMIWESNVLLPRVRIEPGSGKVCFEFTSFIRNQVIHPTIYAPLDALLIASFSCVHTVVLYEILRDYLNSPRIPLLTIKGLRDLLGIEKGTYEPFKYLKRDVIDKAVSEINEKSDLYCSYTLERSGGRRYTHIQFSVHKNEKPFSVDTRMEIPAAILEVLPEPHRTSAVIDILRPYCLGAIDAGFLISNIRYSHRNARENFPHYLAKALAEDYAAHEREETFIRQTAQEQEEMRRLKAERESAEQENLGETLYNQLNPADLLRYTDQVRLDFKSAGVSSQFITEPVIKAKIVEKLMMERESARAGVQEDLFTGS